MESLEQSLAWWWCAHAAADPQRRAKLEQRLLSRSGDGPFGGSNSQSSMEAGMSKVRALFADLIRVQPGDESSGQMMPDGRWLV